MVEIMEKHELGGFLSDDDVLESTEHTMRHYKEEQQMDQNNPINYHAMQMQQSFWSNLPYCIDFKCAKEVGNIPEEFNEKYIIDPKLYVPDVTRPRVIMVRYILDSYPEMRETIDDMLPGDIE